MSLEELLRSRIIRRIRPSRKLVLGSLMRAKRDIETARTLIENGKLDWSLAVSYNVMLLAERALMPIYSKVSIDTEVCSWYDFQVSHLLRDSKAHGNKILEELTPTHRGKDHVLH